MVDNVMKLYHQHVLLVEREGTWCLTDEAEQARVDRAWALHARVMMAGVSLMDALEMVAAMVEQHCTREGVWYDYGLSVNRDAIDMMERVGWYE